MAYKQHVCVNEVNWQALSGISVQRRWSNYVDSLRKNVLVSCFCYTTCKVALHYLIEMGQEIWCNIVSCQDTREHSTHCRTHLTHVFVMLLLLLYFIFWLIEFLKFSNFLKLIHLRTIYLCFSMKILFLSFFFYRILFLFSIQVAK